MGKYWGSLEHYSSWRKIAVGMWGAPDDPTVYGFETLDVSRLLPWLDEVERHSGVKVSVAAYCARAVANIFATYPEYNVIMVGKKVRQRHNVDIFCQVAITGAKADLSGVKLRNVDQMDFTQVAQRLSARADKVRKGQDEEMQQTKKTVNIVPGWLMRPMLKLVDFLTYNVPLELGWMGVRSDPFGTAMVSSVGPFDIKLGFAPLVPASRVPVVFVPGVIHKGVVVNEHNEVEVRDVIQCACTFDHRCYDGYQIGHIATMFRKSVEDPRAYFGEPEDWARTGAELAERPRTADGRLIQATGEDSSALGAQDLGPDELSPPQDGGALPPAPAE